MPRLLSKSSLLLIGLSMTTVPLCCSAQEVASKPPDQAGHLQRFVEEFVPITPGRGEFPQSFEMGSPRAGEEQPIHRVTLADDFAIARYEVPQNLYESVMGANPSRWKGPRNSAEMMSWNDAHDFCRRVTTLLRDVQLIKAEEVIRLPTEAEWEFCCRAGTATDYSFGDQATIASDEGKQATLLDPYAWHTGNAAGNDPPVGARKPNPWGLYDMHGYLWEFTADEWHDSYEDAPADGSAWKSPDGEPANVSIRGGSWKDLHPRLRSAARRSFPVDGQDDAVGFRCVRAMAVAPP
ncbi:MAG: formylglycine-generating enzyme family protein [Planctomycetaceae bacterium]